MLTNVCTHIIRCLVGWYDPNCVRYRHVCLQYAIMARDGEEGGAVSVFVALCADGFIYPPRKAGKVHE